MIRSAEVDFNALGDMALEEQLSCACYEYGRDCAAVLEVVAMVEEWFPQPLETEAVDRILRWDPSAPSLYDEAVQQRHAVLRTLWNSPASICLIVPARQLASTPYLNISPRRREEGKRRIGWQTSSLEVEWRQVKTGLPLEKLAPFVSFPIGSWEYDDNTLVCSFRRWLKARRPTAPYKRKKGRALVPMDWLKHLAIFREREFKRQHGLIINTPTRCARYSSERTIQRSAVEARRIMAKLFRLVLLLKGCKE